MSATERRRTIVTIKATLRELNNQVSLLNRQVSTKVELKDSDLDALDLISRVGPISPGAFARQAGLHPATVTGIIDRLERSGWIAREQDPTDRRGTLVRALPERAGELFQLYSGMNGSVDELCAGYDEQQLATIADFLSKATAAADLATEKLTAN
jgi:DNA-binding MarR family transcriptional regulator